MKPSLWAVVAGRQRPRMGPHQPPLRAESKGWPVSFTVHSSTLPVMSCTPAQLTQRGMVPEGIAPPVPDPGNRQPEMPAQAIAEGKSGRVVVKFVVTETGAVENIQVLKGDEPFVTAVLEVVRTWRFTPTQMDGRPVPVFRTQPFTFNLRR